MAELSKDPVFRELVNTLRDTANEHYKTEKLRQHISTALLGHIAPLLGERDHFKSIYDSASANLRAIGEALGLAQADQTPVKSIEAIHLLQSEITDLNLKLQASEAMIAGTEAVLRITKGWVEKAAQNKADQSEPDPTTICKSVAQLIGDALAQSAPATNNSGKAHCPHDGICHTSEETCAEAQARIAAIAPATEKQGAVS